MPSTSACCQDRDGWTRVILFSFAVGDNIRVWADNIEAEHYNYAIQGVVMKRAMHDDIDRLREKDKMQLQLEDGSIVPIPVKGWHITKAEKIG